MPVKTHKRKKRGVAKTRRPVVMQPTWDHAKSPLVKMVETQGAEKTPRDAALFPRGNLIIALCSAGLVLATFLVYARTFGNSFVNYDDAAYVAVNPQVQQGINDAMIRWAFTTTTEANWHPLTWLSHALDCNLFGLNPAGHHFTSVLLHSLNVVLLFLLLQHATQATKRSLLVAALFALHPINVESVAWVAERKNVLSMLFFLLALAAYGWYVRRPEIKRYLLIVLCFALGLMAKPMIVTLPFVLLLVDFWPLQRVSNWQVPSAVFPVPQASLWRLIIEKVPLLLLSAASSVVTVIAQGTQIEYNQHLPLAARIINAFYAYSMYVVKTFWPAHLAVFYPYQGVLLSLWPALISLLFLTAITIAVWRARSRVYLPVGWFWFLGTLVPMIGVIQVGDQAMADRYAYLPLIGIFVMAVWGAADLAQSRGIDLRWRTALAGVALAILAVVAWRQIGFWHSSDDLWAHALSVTKDNYVAEDHEGTELLLKAEEADGQRYLDGASLHLLKAVRINPNDVVGHFNLGLVFYMQGRLQEAIQQYQLVLKFTQSHELLSKALGELGTTSQDLGDYAAARRYYRDALKMDPENRTPFDKLGQLGMLERANQLAAEAAVHPSARAYLQIGQLQEAIGRIEEARRSYQESLKLDSGMTEARAALDRLKNSSKRLPQM